ncbi:MAG TPA: DUF4350 domain-containing protein [Humibacter sp.]|nr:DUF4350 domain-containing protein [Humibacter sp.]
MLVAVLVVGAAIALAVQLSLATSSADPMGANNPGQHGGQALARVLQQHGVDVRTASTLQEARRAASVPDRTTVMLFDPNGLLDAGQLQSVLALGSDVVAVGPGFQTLSTIAPDIHQAGNATATTSDRPSCSLVVAQDAGRVSGVHDAYRASGDATPCFKVGSAFALAQTINAGDSVTVAGPQLFDNAHVGQAGNAALAIGLLGGNSTLVWYLPSQADVQASGPPTLAEITPGWLTPAILLLIAVVVAAAVWSGRRFGPLVIEDLPVVVRAGETMHGRARLYRRAAARTHALDALRLGALHRIGTLCGLPPSTHVDQIVASAAALTERPVQQVRDLLLDETPVTDASLRASASALRDLEVDVRRAVAGGRPRGSGAPLH